LANIKYIIKKFTEHKKFLADLQPYYHNINDYFYAFHILVIKFKSIT